MEGVKTPHPLHLKSMEDQISPQETGVLVPLVAIMVGTPINNSSFNKIMEAPLKTKEEEVITIEINNIDVWKIHGIKATCNLDTF